MNKSDRHAHNTFIVDLIERFIKDATLVRITVVKGKGVRFTMPCRILNFDHEKRNLTLYHVDEKHVYLIGLNEIDDMSV